MSPSLREQLLALRSRDEQCRAMLEAEGVLFDGYHPRMEDVHRANAQALRAIIDVHGWPDEERVGPEGAEAAWLIAQHSIAEPEFMRLCRQLLDEASQAGRVPRWQFGYMDDRIRVFEGKTQRFGTQFDLKPGGPEVHELMDPAQVDAWRRELGLGPLAEVLARAQGDPLPTTDEFTARRAAGDAWRREVGWIRTGGD